MALEGTIKEFGVAEILQLMAQQQKTGVLVVEHKDHSAEIYFLQGEITETRSSDQGVLLGEMLVRAGLVTEADVRRLLEKQKNTFEYIGQLLIREGLAKKDIIEHVILTQCYEIFYDILQWREGTYRFIPQQVRTDKYAPPLPGLETILLDVLRMIDEWPEIRQVIRTRDMIFGRVENVDITELDEDEMAVYNLADGSSTVQDIIDKSLLGRFAACKTICELLEGGFLRLVAEHPQRRIKKQRVSPEFLAAAGSYAGIIIAFCVLVLLPTGFPARVIPYASPSVQKESAVAGYFQANRENALRTALEMYRLTRGRYPDALSRLAEAGCITPDILADAPAYTSLSDSYRLGEAG